MVVLFSVFSIHQDMLIFILGRFSNICLLFMVLLLCYNLCLCTSLFFFLVFPNDFWYIWMLLAHKLAILVWDKIYCPISESTVEFLKFRWIFIWFFVWAPSELPMSTVVHDSSNRLEFYKLMARSLLQALHIFPSSLISHINVEISHLSSII